MLHRRILAGRIRYSNILFTSLVAAAISGFPSPVSATSPFTLTDGNSSVTIDGGSSAGLNQWLVDGQNQAAQQWFWYRIGSTGGETPINTISPATFSQPNSGTLNLSYANSQIGVQLVYSLVGGTAGSGASDLGEQIKLTNPGNTSIDVHFFQYVDFNLNGTAGGDSVQLGKNLQNKFNEAYQSEGSSAFAETVASPGANHAEVSASGATLTELNDGNPTQLNDSTVAGPGNVTWAFEWDFTLAAGGSLIISKDLNVSVVPEPSLCALGSLGLLGVGWLRRRAKA